MLIILITLDDPCVNVRGFYVVLCYTALRTLPFTSEITLLSYFFSIAMVTTCSLIEMKEIC